MKAFLNGIGQTKILEGLPWNYTMNNLNKFLEPVLTLVCIIGIFMDI